MGNAWREKNNLQVDPNDTVMWIKFRIEGKVKDKNDVYVKKEVSKDEAAIFIKEKENKDEITPISNTAKLSYRDVLVKGKVNENKNTNDFMSKRYEHEMTVRELLCKGMEAISLLPQIPIEYDNVNYDDLPNAPQGEELTEAEQDQRIWESFREAYKDSKAVEYFSKAFKMLERGP
ncbi:hypothetical protein C1645_821776 [Glomus cerebriforme]|uniref:Uncharacterized protein n=1 Tax=Glomus cerebriforme TaxID=658196 RepID=A0A397T9J4_9GLOM|nr:hypothetical protein C1645_821776 [Glomus cerebriforme]